MSGILRVKKDKGYFVASNAPFNDKSLSWEARGVMGYLLSKPDDWQIMFNDLVNNGTAGAHIIRRILKELESHGYLTRARTRDKSGKFTWVSTVYERPQDPAIYQSSIYGKTIDGKTIYGKSIDVLSTEEPSTEAPNTEKTNAPDGAAPPPELTPGQQLTLAKFTAKRFKTPDQRRVIKELEEEHGFDALNEALTWAATKGLTMGQAIVSVKTLLSKRANGHGPGGTTVAINPITGDTQR